MNAKNQLLRSMVLGCAAGLGLMSLPTVAENPGGWEFSVAPLFLWGKSINGSSTIGGVEAPLDLDFQDDVLENLEAAFTVHVEATQGDLTLFAEYNYANLTPGGEETFGPVTVRADIDFKDTMWEAGVAYAVYHTDSTRFEVLGGLRYLEQEIDVEVDRPGVLPIPIPDKVSGGDDWYHGFVGLRVKTRISERWSFVGRADVGYNDSDNKAGHAIGMVDYRFRDWGSFFAGYRYLDTEYDNGKSGSQGYAFNADQQGPILGFNFYF